MHRIDAMVATAERVLSAASGYPVAVHRSDVIVDYEGAAAVLIRCHVEALPDDAPATVIVKQSRSHGADLLREWSNLEFVNTLADTRPLVPRLYGGDRDAQLLVMEDIGAGTGQRLGDIVEGHDADRAEAGLFAFMSALGRLHAATIGNEGRYDAMSLPRVANGASRHRVHALSDHLTALCALLAAEGLAISASLEREIAAMVAQLRSPGAMLAFTHGDAAVGNVIVVDDMVRLIDFETGAYRHAMVDGCYARMRYLQSVWARQMPAGLRRRLADTYRAALVDGCPEASDDTTFNTAMVAGSAAWLASIVGMLPDVRDADRRVGRSTIRQRIVTALGHFTELSGETGQGVALASACAELEHRLRGQWDAEDCEMRICRAFAT